ncbi:MAG: hypothetical protein IT536_16180 [Hyphomicrobiales bacterium]|nr:hypothetical protein [Hyphomicrobiales bacterium]
MPPLLKWALAALGGGAALAWAAREIRRINAELERVKAAPAMDAAARRALPTLRRDPATGVWRLQ